MSIVLEHLHDDNYNSKLNHYHTHWHRGPGYHSHTHFHQEKIYSIIKIHS
jgi:hypothetical protein